jgi:hypothetical protein
MQQCQKCFRARPDAIADPSCPKGGYCHWIELDAPVLPVTNAKAPVWSGWGKACACGTPRSAADPFFLVPNPMLPSRAGAFLLRTVPRQATEQDMRRFTVYAPVPRQATEQDVYASENQANQCHVRACYVCGALYACPRVNE